MVDRKPNEGALFAYKAKPDTPPEKLKYAPNYSGELLIDLASALIEEDAQGYLYIVGRDELDAVERAPVVVAHGTVGYDRWTEGIARVLASPLGRLWSSEP